MKSQNELWKGIQEAKNTSDLVGLHDELTSAWNQRKIDRKTAETLTRLMWERDRQFYQAIHNPTPKAAPARLVVNPISGMTPVSLSR